MKKIKIILGMLIVMAIATCGALFGNTQPPVFATETEIQAQAQTHECDGKCGTFYGEDYYVRGQTATLRAEINEEEGYAFDGWIAIAEDGTQTLLSTEKEYTFVVNGHMNIVHKCHRIEYKVAFEDDLYITGTDLRDFKADVYNKSGEYEEFYYNTPTEVIVSIKNGLYIDKITEKDVTINGVSVYDIVHSENSMGITYTVNMDAKTGFTNFVINLNIKQDIKIGIDYDYMHKLTLKSANAITIDELVNNNLIKLDTPYSKLEDDEYVYLVSEANPIIATMSDNDIYEFLLAQLDGFDTNSEKSQSIDLASDKTFTITYGKTVYEIEFNSYLINLYGEKDLIDLYTIDKESVTAGDSVEFTYNETTKQVTITGLEGATNYDYPADLYGYKFAYFALDGEKIDGNSYTLSATAPQSAVKEIQLIFEMIEYGLEIKLVDDYFKLDETLIYGYTFDNEFNTLVTGTLVTLQASTTKYVINGWSLNALPKVDGYLKQVEGVASDTYSFIFTPTSDTDLITTIYLDIDYQYLTATYNLKSNSIVKNMDYDVVVIDWNNNTITFSNSENANDKITESIVANAEKTVITTTSFGEVTIDAGVLSYTVNQIALNSIALESVENVDTYTFNKYTYFGDLQLGLVEEIVLSENGGDVTVNLNGNLYTDTATAPTTIQSFVSTKTYDDAKGAYLLDYQYRYSMYLYMDESEYDYIVFRDVKYYYNGTKFVLNNATINTPKEVVSEIVKADSYSIKLNNLLSNAVLVYFTNSIDTANYSFSTFTNQKGSTLWNFQDNGANICILNINATGVVNADYIQLANNVNLVINNELAYLLPITFTVQAIDSSVKSGEGSVISAQDNEIVTITIVANNITKGYQFDNFVFNGENVTDTTNPLVYTFVMDSRVYANQTITLEFSAIQYTININYIDQEGNVIEQNQAKGKVRLYGSTSLLESLVVDVTYEGTIEAVANNGYYVKSAYIGTDDELTGLISNNQSTALLTSWTLNSENFEDAVIDNAGESNIVNLYINFAIHTYSVKVYFEIAFNASAITYPTLYINGTEQELIIAAEEEDGVSSTKRFVEASGFEYQTNVVFNVQDYMTGTTILRWANAKDQQLATTSQYTLTQINQDTTLKVVLQYVKYVLEFVSLDEEGNLCDYGSASATNSTIQLYDTVNYSINTELGYVLSNKYYYNREGQIGTENIDSGFTFNPKHFKEESTIKIYLVFTLKIVNLTISNYIEGDMYYYEGQSASDLATFEITRQRGNTIDTLTNETGYAVQTGDIITMKVTPASIGVELNKVQLGIINITNLSSNPYKWTVKDVVEDASLVGMYYVIEIKFTAGVISSLNNETTLQNILQVKTFNVTYTYNYIDYKFGIRLIRQHNGSTATGNPDVAMNVLGIGYGSEVMFSYAYEGMNSGDGAKFNVDGFTVAGIKQTVKDRFRFNDINLWEQVALNKYAEGSNEIAVILVLKPKITLNNYNSYDAYLGYTYERSYVGEMQGLVTTGGNLDVVVGGDFATIIQYSFDGGANFIEEKPMNVGSYPVKIIAKISSDNTQVTDVIFEEKVTYIITPASLSLNLKTYTSTNPISKTYDGTNNLSSKVIADDIVFNGLYAIDEGKVFVDTSRLRAQFADVLVNSANNLYDINVFDVYLLDASNNTIQNYKMLSGQNLVFARIGKINPKELKITGFTVSDKVFDGTTNVVTNVDAINYVGKLETDSTQVLTENLKFYIEDSTVGEDREVFIDWTNALVGADSTNYSITYDKTYIDIYPYEITYELKGYGTFKIVDVDKLCLIPIGSRVVVKAFERGNAEYNTIYSTIEPELSRGEKLKFGYEIIMQVGAIKLQVPENLYVFIPKVSKLNDVFQVPEEDRYTDLEHATQDNYTVVKVTQGRALLGVVVNTTYMPLWLIILIIVLSAIAIGIVVFIVIIIRRKAKQKYSKYDKI